MFRLGVRFFLIAAFLFGFGAPAFSFEATPMRIDLNALGSGTSSRVTVRNNWDRVLAFETSVVRIDLLEDGGHTEVPADDDFIVFPPQGAIQPGSSQAVRVQWAGELEQDLAQLYFVQISQVPVDLEAEDGDAQLQLVYAFNVITQVAPPSAKSNLTIVDFSQQLDEGSVKFTVENIGNTYGRIFEEKILFEFQDEDGDIKRRQLMGQPLRQTVISNGLSVEPMGRRNITVKFPDDFPKGKLTSLRIR